MGSIEAYPLCWPVGYKRTPADKIIFSRFKQTLGYARDFLTAEVKRIGGMDLIISTNIPLRNDGQMYADWTRYKIDDHGAAVYFMYKEKQVCLCCDKYQKIWENIYAIARTIEALRQIDRDGVSDFLDNAFSGFKALPQEATKYTKDCWYILHLATKPENESDVHAAYKTLAKKLHPDVPGGRADQFIELANAYQEALSHFKK